MATSQNLVKFWPPTRRQLAQNDLFRKRRVVYYCVKMKPTPEQVQAVRYAGALGHTHFALSRDKAGALRVQSESCSLIDALRISHGEQPPECVMTRLGQKRQLFRVA